jgi:predicted transcriptional regulator
MAELPVLSFPVLPHCRFSRTLKGMEVHFAPDLQARIDQIVIETGRAPEKLIEDAMAGYVAELAQTREMLNSRYDDLKSGRVKPIDGEAFFESLRKREDESLNKQ